LTGIFVEDDQQWNTLEILESALRQFRGNQSLGVNSVKARGHAPVILRNHALPQPSRPQSATNAPTWTDAHRPYLAQAHTAAGVANTLRTLFQPTSSRFCRGRFRPVAGQPRAEFSVPTVSFSTVNRVLRMPLMGRTPPPGPPLEGKIHLLPVRPRLDSFQLIESRFLSLPEAGGHWARDQMACIASKSGIAALA
jgi:hypothetical protein